MSACALAEGGDAAEECVPAEDRAEALAALRLREGLAENGPWQRSREEWRAEDVELEVGGMGGGEEGEGVAQSRELTLAEERLVRRYHRTSHAMCEAHREKKKKEGRANPEKKRPRFFFSDGF